jgi:NAD(P)-dependent dehydrogenase (short-subunit alcohol dehydrogenase family)
MSEDIPRAMPLESRGDAPGRGRLTGRRVLVVGGGQDTRGLDDPPIGNGRAMCLLFAREGAKVAVADRNYDSAEATVALMNGAPLHWRQMPAFRRHQAMVAEAAAKFGGGWACLQCRYRRGRAVAGGASDEWDRVFAVYSRCDADAESGDAGDG